MSTKVIIGLNIVFSIIVLVLWQRYSDVISRWETDHAIQVTAIAQQQMTATAQFKVVMATGTVEAKAAAATATAAAQKLTNLAEQKQDTEQQYQHTEQKYQETLAQKLGAEAALRLNDEPDPTLGTLLAAESVRRYQAVEGDVALRRGIELLSWKRIFTAPHGGSGIGFNANGERLVTIQNNCRMCQNLNMKTWDVNTGQTLPTFSESISPGNWSSRLSPDGRLFAIDKWNNIEVMVVATGQIIFTQTLRIEGDIAFSSDGQQLAVVSGEKAVTLHNVATGKILREFKHDQPVQYVDFSSQGQWLLTSNISGTAWVWDTKTGQPMPLTIPAKTYEWFRFSHDEQRLFAIHQQTRLLYSWQITSGQVLTPVLQIDSKLTSSDRYIISPDDQWVAIANQPNTSDVSEVSIQVKNLTTGLEVARLVSTNSYQLYGIMFSPDGHWLVVADDEAVHFWEVGSWREVARLMVGGVRQMAFSANSQRFALTSNTITEIVEHLQKSSPAKFPTNNVLYPSLTFSPDERYLTVTYRYSDTHYGEKTWDITTGQEVMLDKPKAENKGGEEAVQYTMFSPDKKLGILYDGFNITILSMANEQVITTLLHMAGYNSQMVFSPDSQYLAVANGNEGFLWQTTSPYTITHLIQDSAFRVAFSPNGQLLSMASSSGVLHVWDMTTKKEVKQLSNPYEPSALKFSPDGQWLAVTSFKGTWDWKILHNLQIWETATWRSFTLPANQISSYSFQFSPNSQWLITGNGRVWEVATGRAVAQMPDYTNSAMFSPSGRYIVTSNDKEVMVWPWQAADMVAVACQRLSRNLTETEWQQYLGDEPYRKTCPNLEEK